MIEQQKLGVKRKAGEVGGVTSDTQLPIRLKKRLLVVERGVKIYDTVDYVP